jgi:catalase
MNQGKNTFMFNAEAKYEPYKVTGLVARHKPNHPNCDFEQPGALFRRVFCDTMRKHTIGNIVRSMNGVPRDICERAIKNFYKSDPEFGDGISKGLGFPSVKSRL